MKRRWNTHLTTFGTKTYQFDGCNTTLGFTKKAKETALKNGSLEWMTVTFRLGHIKLTKNTDDNYSVIIGF